MKTPAFLVIILVLAFIGIADAWYLTQSMYTLTPLSCDITGLDGCNTVAQSVYSHLFGYPLALYGVFFYGFIFALAAAALFAPRRIMHAGLFLLGLLGLVSSIVFIAIQVGLIKAVCVYCLLSALISLLIFVCTALVWKRERSASFVPREVHAVLP